MSSKTAISLVEFKGKHRVRIEGVVEYNPYPACVVFVEIHENHKQDKVFRMQLSIQQVFAMLENAKALREALPSMDDNAKKLSSAVRTESGETKSAFYYGVHRAYPPVFYLNLTKHNSSNKTKETLNISMDTIAFQAHIKRLECFCDHTQKRYFELYETFSRSKNDEKTDK